MAGDPFIQINIRKTHFLVLSILMLLVGAASTVNIRDPLTVFHGDVDLSGNSIQDVDSIVGNGPDNKVDVNADEIDGFNSSELLNTGLSSGDRKVVASAGLTKEWTEDKFNGSGYSISTTRATTKDIVIGKQCSGYYCSTWDYPPTGDVRMFPYDVQKSNSYNFPPPSCTVYQCNSDGWEKETQFSMDVSTEEKIIVEAEAGDACDLALRVNNTDKGDMVTAQSNGYSNGPGGVVEGNDVEKVDVSGKSTMNFNIWYKVDHLSYQYDCNSFVPGEIKIYYPNTNQGKAKIVPDKPDNVNFWSTATYFNVSEPGNSDVQIDVHKENGDLYKKDIKPSTPISDLNGTNDFYFNVYFDTDDLDDIPKLDYLAFNGVT